MFARRTAAHKTIGSQTADFLELLFDPSDLIEIRLIETWKSDSKTCSKVIDRRWERAHTLIANLQSFRTANENGANVFFGVNPRLRMGSKKGDVALCRCLWADIDSVQQSDTQRWQCLPEPSLIVDSGHGVHLYWILKESFVVSNDGQREHVEGILKGMYQILSADSVQDVSRILRLPGFANVKNFRNGAPPLPCVIPHTSDTSYDLVDFEPDKAVLPEQSYYLNCATIPNDDRFTSSRIRGLMRLLGKDTEDRSKRDFYVVIRLLSLGCSQTDIQELVSTHSKFAGNARYLQQTIQNAQKVLKQQNG